VIILEHRYSVKEIAQGPIVSLSGIVYINKYIDKQESDVEFGNGTGLGSEKFGFNF